MYLLEEEYELLTHYLEQMISEGVLLIVGNTNLFEWSDTKIPDVLAEIKKKRDAAKKLSVEVGNVLTDRRTGQPVEVLSCGNETVTLKQPEQELVFPKTKLGLYYKK